MILGPHLPSVKFPDERVILETLEETVQNVLLKASRFEGNCLLFCDPTHIIWSYGIVNQLHEPFRESQLFAATDRGAALFASLALTRSRGYLTFLWRGGTFWRCSRLAGSHSSWLGVCRFRRGDINRAYRFAGQSFLCFWGVLVCGTTFWSAC